MNKELEWLQEYVRKGVAIGGFDDEDIEILNKIEKELKALKIIKQCLVSEFKLYEKDGEYFIFFYMDDVNSLEFKLKDKEEYKLLKDVLG